MIFHMFIDETQFQSIEEKQVLGIIIDDDLTFIPLYHILSSPVCNRLTLYLNLSPRITLQLYTRIHKIKTGVYIEKLESTLWGALSLFLRTVRSTPTDSLKVELSITPKDLRLEQLQRHETIKMLWPNHSSFFSHMSTKSNWGITKQSPLWHLIAKKIKKTPNINSYQSTNI